jgi:predicted helicase
MACGTGKTLVALWVAERLNPKTVLVLLPSLILVQQTLDEWSKHNNWGKRFSYMCVCSDRTVAGNDDTVQLSTIDMTFRVDTDPEHVRKFLERPTDHVRVVFSTYQSSKVVGDAAEVVRGHI